jgi:hypothetical protein
MSTHRNLVFCFSGTEQGVIHTFDEEDAEENALAIMRSTQPRNHFLSGAKPLHFQFSDLGYYQGLCAEQDCVNVRISRVRCLYGRYFMGIEVVYRSTFADGTTQETEAPTRAFASGYYSYLAGKPEVSDLELENGEFITGLRFNQGEIIDGVTFVTNRREVHFGGYGGTTYDMMPSKHLNVFRILAFTGTESGVMHRIGYFAKVFPWGAVGPFVMLRWLVKQQRAAPTDAEGTQEQLLVQRLVGVERFPFLNDDAFQRVMEFLIPKSHTESRGSGRNI